MPLKLCIKTLHAFYKAKTQKSNIIEVRLQDIKTNLNKNQAIFYLKNSKRKYRAFLYRMLRDLLLACKRQF
jgi:hypothetical protein